MDMSVHRARRRRYEDYYEGRGVLGPYFGQLAALVYVDGWTMCEGQRWLGTGRR